MSQFARPDSDISAGSWATAPLYAKIDEVTYSDADYISVTSNANTCELGLSTVTDPVSSASHIVRFRSRKALQGTSVTVTLMDGATTIRSFAQALGNTSTAYSFTLTSGEADNIGDYSDLRLKLTSAIGRVGSVFISWAELEVPDAGSPPISRRIFVV